MKDKTLTLRMEAELVQQIKDAAWQARMSMAEWVAQACRDKLK